MSMNLKETMGIGLLTSFIYDLIKLGLKKIRTNVISRDRLIVEIQNRIGSEIDDVIETDAFYSFIQSPTTHDLLFDYINYKISSKIVSKAQVNINNEQKKNNQIYTEELVSEELAIELRKRFQAQSEISVVQKPGNDRITIATERIVSIITTLLVEQLDTIQLSQVFLINDHMDVGFSIIINQLNWLTEKKKNTCKNNDILDYENQLSTIHEYNNMIKSACKNAHIYLMAEFSLSDFYISPILLYDEFDSYVGRMELSQQTVEKNWNIWRTWDEIEYSHIFDINNIVYIVGGAGYGKSLFLRYLILNNEKMCFMDASNYLIIYGQLRDYYQYNNSGPSSVISFLQNCMVIASGLDQSILTKELIQTCLADGRCFILLDALDEVPREHRQELHHLLVNFFKNQNANNKICITSRGRGFIPETDVNVYRIMPLTMEQVDQYVNRIIELNYFSKADKEGFIEQAGKLIQSGFLTSFLILSLLLSIYKAEKELPETKLDLYQKCFEYIARKREMEKSTHYDWNIMRTLLDDNAFIDLAQLGAPNNAEVKADEITKKLLNIYEDEYSDKNQARNAIEEFIKFCSERTEVYVPASTDNTFRFFHRSLYEFFFSKYITVRINDAQQIYETLIEIDLDSEVFELVIARLKNENLSRCNELLNLLCRNMESDLKSKEPSFIQLNILSLTLPLITNYRIINEYIDLLCKYGQVISLGRNSLISGNNIVKLIEENEVFSKRIYDSYLSFAYEEIMYIVNQLIDTLHYLNRFSHWDESKIAEYCQFSLYQQISFYTKICSKLHPEGILGLIKTMQSGWLKVYFGESRLGRRKYKRTTGHLAQIIRIIEANEKTNIGFSDGQSNVP